MSDFPLILPLSSAEVIIEFMGHSSPGTAGMHGFLAWGTTTDRRTSAYAGLHESIHELVISGTPFGFLQRYFRSFRQPQVNPRRRAWADRWTRVLMQESHTAHEAAATYLSITMLRSHEQAAIIHSLTPEYRRYYDLLAGPLDATVRSTFMRYAIGQWIVALAFHSPLLLRVASQRMAAPRALSGDDSPNARLLRTLAFLQSHSLESLVATVVADLAPVAAAAGYDGFDANDEAAWLNATPALRQDLDAVMDHSIHTWLGLHEYDLPVSDPKDASAAVPRLLRHAKKVGVFLGVVDAAFLRKFWPEPTTVRSAQRELMNAETVLFNQPTIDDKPADELPENQWPVPRSPATRTVVVCARELYVPDAPNDWYLCLAGEGGCGPTWSLSQARLDAFCSDRRSAWRKYGGTARDNDLYVLGLPAPLTPEPDDWTVRSLYAAMQLFRTQEEPAGDSDVMHFYGNLDRLVVYMHGNMMSWVNWFDYLPGPRYCTLFFGEEPGVPEFPDGDTTLGMTLEGLPMGIGAHILGCELFPITFLRLANTWAFRSTSAAIATYATRTKRFTLGCPTQDEVRIHQLIETTVPVLETVWSVF